jgi:hypothetical protein
MTMIVKYRSHSNVPNINKPIWKMRVPLKIKIFLWYLRKCIILTEDNLAKRNQTGSKRCCFCHKMRQLYTCFLTAIFLRLYGQLFMCQQEFYLSVVSQTCLGLGYGGLVLILDLSYFLGATTFC